VDLPLAELFDGLQSVFGLTEFNVFGLILILVFGGNGGFLGVGFGLGARLVVAVDEAEVGWRRHRYRISLLGKDIVLGVVGASSLWLLIKLDYSGGGSDDAT
jgi:hypothetical protein